MARLAFCAMTSLLAGLLTQSGWALAGAKPREVGRTYWEVIPEMEVWLRLVPEDPDGKPSLVNLIFHAFFPGRARLKPYSLLPDWPKGAPKRLTLSAEPLPLTVIQKLVLHFQIEDRTLDLTAPGTNYRNLPCLVASADCTPNAVEADVDASLVRLLASARSVSGVALGFPITLTAADQDAIRAFAERAGVPVEAEPDRHQ